MGQTCALNCVEVLRAVRDCRGSDEGRCAGVECADLSRWQNGSLNYRRGKARGSMHKHGHSSGIRIRVELPKASDTVAVLRIAGHCQVDFRPRGRQAARECQSGCMVVPPPVSRGQEQPGDEAEQSRPPRAAADQGFAVSLPLHLTYSANNVPSAHSDIRCNLHPILPGEPARVKEICPVGC